VPGRAPCLRLIHQGPGAAAGAGWLAGIYDFFRPICGRGKSVNRPPVLSVCNLFLSKALQLKRIARPGVLDIGKETCSSCRRCCRGVIGRNLRPGQELSTGYPQWMRRGFRHFASWSGSCLAFSRGHAGKPVRAVAGAGPRRVGRGFSVLAWGGDLPRVPLLAGGWACRIGRGAGSSGWWQARATGSLALLWVRLGGLRPSS